MSCGNTVQARLYIQRHLPYREWYFATFQQCFDYLHRIIQELVTILHDDTVIHSKIWITQFQLISEFYCVINFTLSASAMTYWFYQSNTLHNTAVSGLDLLTFNLQLCVQSFVLTAVTRATTNLYETAFPFICCLLQWEVEELFFVVTNLIQLGYIKQWPMRGGVIASLICRKCIFC